MFGQRRGVCRLWKGAVIRILVLILFLPAAVLAAGLFGIVHDQISYTVSNEYFTRFKFIQFGLQYWAAPDRTRAAVVGFMAPWWMGIPLGLFCGAAGLM